MKLREFTRQFIKFKVGSGCNIYLWLDNWHPDGILYEKYGFRAVYDAGSNIDAKLSVVLVNRSWRWLPARSDYIVAIQSKLHLIQLGDIDEPVWSN